MSLKEYYILKSDFELRANDSFLTTLHKSIADIYTGTSHDAGNLKMVSLDDVTSYLFNTFDKYKNSWKSKKLDSAKVYNDKINEIQGLINERARLDSYFNIQGYKIEIIRIYMLKLLIKLQNEGFVREINRITAEMNFDYPRIEDILLSLFVSSVKEFDEYYLLNIKASKNIIVNNTWEVPKKSDMEFYICKSTGNRLIGFIGNQQFEVSFDLEGAFAVMVLFVNHIKKMHFKYGSSKKADAFNELVKSFDIIDERYLDLN